MKFEDIRVERMGDVVQVTIARPDTRNACRRQTIAELSEALRRQIAQDARAVVLSGDERAFSSGADLKEMRDATNEERDFALSQCWLPLLDRIDRAPIPFIAAIRGYCVAGGLEIALACHIRIASTDAKLGLTEILRGHIPGGGGTVRLPRLVGESNALRFLLTGDLITAEAALRLGIVSEVLAPADTLPHALALAQRIATMPRKAVELTLRSVVDSRDLPLPQALEREIQACREMRVEHDYAEGLDAFGAKRSAKYR